MVNKIISDPSIVMELKRNNLPLNADGLAKLNEIRTVAQAEARYRIDKSELSRLSEDITQFSAGIAVDNIKAKKERFLLLLNRVRYYEGKPDKRFY